MSKKQEHYYIIAVHSNVSKKIDGKVKTTLVESIYLTDKLRKRHINDAAVIIDVAQLKMVKDRYKDYSMDDLETSLRYIELFSTRNKEVKKIYDELVNVSIDNSNIDSLEDDSSIK